MSDDIRYSDFAISLPVFTPPFFSTDVIILTRAGIDYQVSPVDLLQQELSYDYVQPSTGDTYAAAEGLNAVLIDPAGAIAVLNLVLPPNPGDGDVFEVSTTQDISSIPKTAASGAVFAGTSGNSGGLPANGGISWRYRLSLNTWFPRY
jgi:hypothetical protein